MLNRIVIVGTGTEVGKTWITSALARASLGHALALKPIETGCAPNAAPDAEKLCRAAGRPYCPPLYAFPDPVTPWLAAERAGAQIDLGRVSNWVTEHEHQALHDTTPLATATLIESAGGVFSPLGPGLTNYELAAALQPCSLLLVAPNRLGVLHDVAATLLAMAHLGEIPTRVVLNAAEVDDPSAADNADLLTRQHSSIEFFSVKRADEAAVVRLWQQLTSLTSPL